MKKKKTSNLNHLVPHIKFDIYEIKKKCEDLEGFMDCVEVGVQSLTQQLFLGSNHCLCLSLLLEGAGFGLGF